MRSAFGSVNCQRRKLDQASFLLSSKDLQKQEANERASYTYAVMHARFFSGHVQDASCQSSCTVSAKASSSGGFKALKALGYKNFKSGTLSTFSCRILATLLHCSHMGSSDAKSVTFAKTDNTKFRLSQRNTGERMQGVGQLQARPDGTASL